MPAEREPAGAGSRDIDGVIAEAAVAPPLPTPAPALESSQTAKSLFDGFVRDLQQLVVEWEGAA